MPLLGKIVVIKRSGGDGTEFPLTASCLFGRKVDCDIRIQLPQVSKEHCRIDLNENKELILTNLSSVNPTRVNGEALQQSERLKHGDVITIIDRSFRFEYPPAPTPKKRRSSTAGKTEKLQVLQDQQVRGPAGSDASEKIISEASTDPHLKDGTNSDNIQQPLEKSIEVGAKEDGSQTDSPFRELYQMIKQTLDGKTPRKSSVSQPQTPGSRFYTPKHGSARKVDVNPVEKEEVKNTPKKEGATGSSGTTAGEATSEVENKSVGTPKSAKKQRKSFKVPTSQTGLLDENKPAEQAAKSTATPSPQRRLHATPQRFTVNEVVEQISAANPKTPTRRRSKETTPVTPSVSKEEEQAKVTELQQNTPKTELFPRTSPRSTEKKLKAQDVLRELDDAGNEKGTKAKKRKSGETGASEMKKKRVSFGGHLSPELFDRRLPPDSPLRKGATPRRSLCLSKPKHSLLRRTSVIGLIKEFEHEHPAPASPHTERPAKTKTPSPKKSSSARSPSPKTPSPGTKSPKARSPSPRTPSPGKKSPKTKTPSPKAPSPGTKSPKARTPLKNAALSTTPTDSKTPSPARGRSASRDKSNTPKAEKSPKSQGKSATPATPTGKRRSSPVVSSPTPQENMPAVGVTPAKSPLAIENHTPTVQGRFSVSRISTPSPVTDQDAAAAPVPSVPVTPKLPLRRTSMKSTSQRRVMKNAVEVMRRRSGISRASLNAKNSWANIVKFGQIKSQVVAPAKKTVAIKKTKKVTVPKPKTPARKLKDHVSTGHADSPVTIVVGKAYKQTVVLPTGAAPRLMHNTALFKKDMKMDEDLTGISEIFKTPVNARQRKSVIIDQSVTKTPQGALGTAIVEASVLNTPEEMGEMMVSPLSVASAVKCGTYNSEAVHRLLQDEEESSFVSEDPASEISPDGSNEQQCTDMITAITTPKQKPVQPESLTGVKRIMKTPRQKAEPVEDLRGKLLKTPKQKPEQHECLTGVKRIMKTPRQKAEPVEDLRGKLLKTPKAPKVSDVSLDGIKELLETPHHNKEPAEDVAEVMATKTPNVKSSPMVCATGIKRLMRTPKEKNAAVEDMAGVARLMKTPKEKGEPVEANFGIKRLMRSPRLRGNAPVEDFEGLQELMEEPCSAQTETNEEMEILDQDQAPLPCGIDTAKEAQVPCEEQQKDVPCAQNENEPMDDTVDVPQADMVKESEVNEIICGDQLEEVPCGQDEDKPSDTMEAVPKAAVDQSFPEEPEVQKATCEIVEMETASIGPVTQKKSARGRRAKGVGSKAIDDKQDAPVDLEEATVSVPVRGRRAKTTGSAPPPAVRQTTRNRKAQSNEGSDVELTAEVSDCLDPKGKSAPKPRRGRNTRKASEDHAEIVPEVAVEAEQVPEVAVEAEQVSEVAVEAEQVSEVAVEAEQVPEVAVEAEQVPEVAVEAVSDQTPLVEVALKPKRGRKVSKKTEVVSDQPQPEEPIPTEAQPEEAIPIISVKKTRGRKTKQDSVEQNEVVEENAIAVQTMQQSKAPARAKRGKNAKHDEEKVDVDVQISHVETTESQEPIQKSRRTRNTKQNPVEPKEVNMVEDPVEEKLEAPPVASKGRRTRMRKQDSLESEESPVESASLAESVELHEQPAVEPAEKPRRGGRKAKQNAEDVTPVESTEVQDKPSANLTEKPKRGKRAKQEKVTDEVEVIPEVPEPKAEQKQEVEENRDDADSSSTLANEQQDAPVIKPTRGRGVKSVKNEVLQVIPAKRARRGAASSLQEAAVTETTVVSKPSSRGRAGRLSKADGTDEPAEVSVEPARRGRKAATKPTDNATNVPSTEVMVEEKVANAEPTLIKVKKGVSKRGKATSTAHSDQANITEDVNNTVLENTVLKKSVNWKADLAVTYEIKTPTSDAKAARGRKTKIGDQDKASQETPTKRSRRNPEPTEPSTSDTTTKPEIKRRPSRNASKAEEEDLSGKAEPIKKTRRGGKATATASVEAHTQGAEEMESTNRAPAKRRVNAPKKAVADDSAQAAEAETQPKTRRGRPAKK